MSAEAVRDLGLEVGSLAVADRQGHQRHRRDPEGLTVRTHAVRSRRWSRHPSSLLARMRVAGDDGSERAAAPGAATAEPELTGELTVYAAASLKAAFDELETQFEARHPSLDVLPVVYDGSSTLAAQLIEGAPADVFASADENNMQKVVDAGLGDRSASCSRPTRSCS